VDAKALAERRAAVLGSRARADPIDAAGLVGLAAQQNGRAVTYADVAVPWPISGEVPQKERVLTHARASGISRSSC